MGRHVWRLLKPKFALKMLRTRAPKLYGWRTLLNGNLGPGPNIGQRSVAQIREVLTAGHEIGLHAWDHHFWQRRLDLNCARAVGEELGKGYEALSQLVGGPIMASAAPAWMSSDEVCRQKKGFPFSYNSDCRGDRIFWPRLMGNEVGQLQVPTTLPIFDEIVGTANVTTKNFFGTVVAQLRQEGLNLYTAHAEVEGLSLLKLFGDFLRGLVLQGYQVVPLNEILNSGRQYPIMRMTRRSLAGRDGWLSYQQVAL